MKVPKPATDVSWVAVQVTDYVTESRQLAVKEQVEVVLWSEDVTEPVAGKLGNDAV